MRSFAKCKRYCYPKKKKMAIRLNRQMKEMQNSAAFIILKIQKKDTINQQSIVKFEIVITYKYTLTLSTRILRGKFNK